MAEFNVDQLRLHLIRPLLLPHHLLVLVQQFLESIILVRRFLVDLHYPLDALQNGFDYNVLWSLQILDQKSFVQRIYQFYYFLQLLTGFG